MKTYQNNSVSIIKQWWPCLSHPSFPCWEAANMISHPSLNTPKSEFINPIFLILINFDFRLQYLAVKVIPFKMELYLVVVEGLRNFKKYFFFILDYFLKGNKAFSWQNPKKICFKKKILIFLFFKYYDYIKWKFLFFIITYAKRSFNRISSWTENSVVSAMLKFFMSYRKYNESHLKAIINKAIYTATSRGWLGREGNLRFPTFQLERDGPTNQPTNWPIDGRTDKASYWVVC